MSATPQRRSKRIAEKVDHDAVPLKKIPWEEQQLHRTIKRLQSKIGKLKGELDEKLDCLEETEDALEQEKIESALLRKKVSAFELKQIDWKTCEICAVQYGDSGMTVPRVLPCGHTICTECAGNFYQNKRIRCPFDRKVYKFNNKTIENLPKNFSLINQ